MAHFFNFGYFSIHNQVNCAKAEAIGSISLSNKAAYLPAHQHTCLFIPKHACNGCFFIAARNNKIFAKTEIFLDYICFFGCVQQGLFWISFFEWNRQLFHIFLGIVIVVLLMYGILGYDITVLGIIIRYVDILGIIILGFLLSYLSKKIKIPVIYQLLQKLERNEELQRFPGKGTIFYFIGVFVSLMLFPKDIAMASIMVLALGDSISHLFGLHYGRTRHPLSKTKFLEGTIAGFAAGFIGALVFLPWHEAFFASLAAMIVEAIEVKIGTQQVDDNLLVPLVAGAVVLAIRLF